MKPSSLSAKRLYLKAPIGYRSSYERQNQKGVLKNISLTGAFLEFSKSSHSLEKPSYKRDKIIIYFSVSGRQRKVFSSIIWKNEKGFGVQFHPTNKRDLQIVDDFMYFTKLKKESKKELFKTILNQLSAS